MKMELEKYIQINFLRQIMACIFAHDHNGEPESASFTHPVLFQYFPGKK
ncbi:MAG: hypothetical protein WA144_13340 [Candidatus Methanoperedens sp.]